jgi:hypothetical protein
MARLYLEMVSRALCLADVDLQPVAVMFQFMRPARANWGLLGDDWLARMDESGRRIDRPAARVTHTPQHAGDIGEFPA